MLSIHSPRSTSAWVQLCSQSQSPPTIQQLFAQEPNRVSALSFCSSPLGFLDCSKQRLSLSTLPHLLAWAAQMDLSSAIKALSLGEAINQTEQCAVRHMALRAPPGCGSGAVEDEVHCTLSKMRHFCQEAPRSTPMTHVVHLGIGGSALGPTLALEALAPEPLARPLHIVSSTEALHALLTQLPPEQTLFIVASKSFTTQETLMNAALAQSWLREKGTDVAYQMVGISAHPDRMTAFGIAPERQFKIGPWVGGRYSLWSAMSLGLALSLGFDRFEALLAGAYAMDHHFLSEPFDRNLPVLSALFRLWNTQCLQIPTEVVVPYSHRLRSLPAYLQQLSMESNGKRIGRDGGVVEGMTSPIVWGGCGPEAEHAFFQLLHQGTHPHNVEFIVPVRPQHPFQEAHHALLAHALAQSQALAFGQSDPTQEKHWHCLGNQPSTTLLLPEVTPFYLGSLLAYYEHRVFVEGVMLNIFSFDQWGVELGKQLSAPLFEALQRGGEVQADASTQQLLRRVRQIERSE